MEFHEFIFKQEKLSNLTGNNQHRFCNWTYYSLVFDYKMNKEYTIL